MELKTMDEVRHAAAALATGNGEALDRLVWTGVFGATELRDAARAAVLAQCKSAGIYPASIHGLYTARGRGEAPLDFTVPAINVRAMAYDTMRAMMRARKALDVGTVIVEIARSEATYTDQRPAEYAFVLMAAALREGVKGPVFIQGDHFQVNAKKYAVDAKAELNTVREITTEAMAAGFYNIDVDTSTLVDLSHPTLEAQQRLNGTHCAEITAYIRKIEPKGVTVSVGGEIGEVGHKNSTPEEMDAFMSVFQAELAKLAPGKPGISKISIQTGTSHGGVPLPDGSIAQVSIDFEAIRAISARSRERYHMGGAVQHGASTLPAELFDRFPQLGACEIHLATEFQNMVFDHPSFPADLKRSVYDWLREAAASERKATDTDEQFFYKARKKATGQYKRQLWSLPADVRAAIGKSLEDKFTALFKKLNVVNTSALAAKWAPFVEGSFPSSSAKVAAGGPEDVTGLSD